MKALLKLTLVIFTLQLTYAQNTKGTVVIDSIYSENLVNNFGENPTREVAVYLPPNYDKESQKYPVIYFLHGFFGDHTLMDYMKEILDFGIETKRIRPFILVIPNQKTTYDGSFYSNSGVFGNWENFTVQDLVKYMDKNYRTLAKKESRGITGHSMGGYGALNIAMKHPDVFNTVYAISPGALAIVREYGPNSETFKELSGINTYEALEKTYFGKVMVAFARSWSPNPNNPPFYCDFPFSYENDELVIHQETLKKWQDHMTFYNLEKYIDNLKSLKAIKMDWGRNAGERFTQQCKMFSIKLENLGINHMAEEYIGTHTSNIYTKDGRIPQQVLPFFEYYLEFD
ncbi:alpha/beta hydrolase [Flagellimonas zhangzhouensis]|uniref:Putative esterase n=1 Tax=Flagellimonas zhangzhouensis TaxID=1073328 RepID=A0A1H2YC12_9FLAO|nr:alpha/beta hydrolase-fold protein [Allomuricauda zhangzhouensis]SDQ97466.1 Putative esterase [Allomuricauda zhangzhouensis]SDX02505.1 Putative esterase [Allomuricauda zhangzhouensis]